jgi:hypothetical protein
MVFLPMIGKGLNELKAKVAFTVACAAGSVELIINVLKHMDTVV